MSSQLFEVLESMSSGRTLKKLEQQFADLRHAVAENEGKGKLVIELNVSFGKKNLHKVVCKTSIKLPQEEPEAAIFYLNENNDLVRDDPRQAKLFPDEKLVDGTQALKAAQQ